MPRRQRQVVELLDQRRRGLSTHIVPSRIAARPGIVFIAASSFPSSARKNCGSVLLGLALEHVVEVAGVEEDPLVDRRVRAAHDRDLAAALRVLRPGDRATDVRRERVEADDVVLSIASRIAVSFTMRSSTSSTGIFSRSRDAPR
jgi:hypothetical protein